MTRILILGGTAEAASLAGILSRRSGAEVTTSLAGILPDRPDLPGAVRLGGFGGVCGLKDHLVESRVDVLVDATHPFAGTMAGHAHQAAAAAGVPRIKLLRPMWTMRCGDRWIEVDDASRAAHALARLAPPAALVTLGSRSLEPFARLEGLRLVFRMIAMPATPIDGPGIEIILERGPFDPVDEKTLMIDHGIGALVTRASGGEATEAKIEAARELALPVVMIRRPPPPPGPTVAAVDDVLDWLESESIA